MSSPILQLMRLDRIVQLFEDEVEDRYTLQVNRLKQKPEVYENLSAAEALGGLVATLGDESDPDVIAAVARTTVAPDQSRPERTAAPRRAPNGRVLRRKQRARP